MFEYVKKNKVLAVIGGLVLTAVVAVPVMAQRDPAYEAARSSGVIGEKPDGYLGYVTSPSSAIKALVEDINIKRKAAYTQSAQANGSTVEQFAFTTGCNLVARVPVGEMYKTPSGQWKENTGTPELDGRCK